MSRLVIGPFASVLGYEEEMCRYGTVVRGAITAVPPHLKISLVVLVICEWAVRIIV